MGKRSEWRIVPGQDVIHTHNGGFRGPDDVKDDNWKKSRVYHTKEVSTKRAVYVKLPWWEKKRARELSKTE